jgi:hypothetical protein
MLAADPTLDTKKRRTRISWRAGRDPRIARRSSFLAAYTATSATCRNCCFRRGDKVRLKNAKRSFYILAKAKDSATFRFLDAQLFVNRGLPSPTVLLAHANALLAESVARYHLTRVELKHFTFSSGSQSQSIDNAVVLGRLTKSLLFARVKNDEFHGTVSTNPYNFRHHNFTHFVMYVNGRPVPSEGWLSLEVSHEKTSVMCYRTFFTGSGIHHSNAGLLITTTCI